MIKWICIQSGLLIILLIFLLEKGFAQELPTEDLIVSLQVNYEPETLISSALRDKQGNILIPVEDLQKFNVSRGYLAKAFQIIGDQYYANLSLLNNLKYDFDEASLSITINFPPEAMNRQVLETSPSASSVTTINETPHGLIWNYNFTFTDGYKEKYVSGLQEVNYFSDMGNITNSFLITRAIPVINGGRHKTQKDFIRLETNWTYDDLGSIARWRIGDSITKAADWSGATRFAGVQYATNFAVRPNLITYPLLDFSGTAELPSTIDIYANSQKIYEADVKTGNFDINDLPIITGKGDLIVRTKDISGKITTLVIPYYVSPTILKKDLSAFSYDFGMQRINYGIESEKYKNPITNIDYMYGISDKWTLGGHFQSFQNLSTLGTTTNFIIGNYGVIGGSIATNLHKFKQAQLISLGYNFQGENFNLNLSGTKTDKYYRDIFQDGSNELPQYSYQLSIGYFDENLGSFYLTYLAFTNNQNNRQQKSQIISGSYGKEIRENIFFRVSAGTQLRNKTQGAFVFISLAVSLDNKHNATLSGSRQSGAGAQQVNFNSSTGGEIGYEYNINLYRDNKRNIKYDLELNKNTEVADFSYFLFDSNHNKRIQQFNGQGALVFMDKNFFLTKPVYDSVALVKTNNIPNIGVYSNNQIIGHTNKKGQLIIPNLPSYLVSTIRLDDQTLPFDAEFADDDMKIMAKSKSGVIADFKISKVRAVQMTLHTEDNKDVAFDTKVEIEGLSEEELFVGYDGVLFISDVKELKLLKGKACYFDTNCCSFEKEIDSSSEDAATDLGEIICH